MAKKGLLSFTVRRTMQDTAVKRFGKRELAPFQTTQGNRPSRSVVEYLRRNRSALAAYRKISRNAGKRFVNRVQKRQRSLDLIDTRLMISSWNSKLVDVSETGLVADISLTNKAPYASFAHPKGTPRSRTFVKNEVKDITLDIGEELAIDQAQYISGIAAAIAADAVRSAFVSRIIGG